MRRLALALLAVVVLPASAQTGRPRPEVPPPAPAPDPMAPAVAQFREAVRTVGRFAAAALLHHDRTGAFPDSPFALLGSPEAGDVGLRALPLSSLTVTAEAQTLRAVYVPLPSPYVRDDEVVTVTVTAGGAPGVYRADYEIVRRDDLDRGGRPLPYVRAPGYRIERGVGTMCLDATRVRALLATGDRGLPPDRWSEAPLSVELHPVGAETPVYYASPRTDDR